MAQEVEKFEWASDTQEELFNWGPTPILASGGYGSGKTTIALLKLLYLADKFPGFRCAIIRRRYNELWKTTLATFFKLIPPSAYMNGGKRNDQAGVLILNNGSRFDFIHLEKADSSTVLRGIELNAAFIDQAEEVGEDVFDLLETRLGRWDKAEISPKVIEEYEKTKGSWFWTNAAGTKLPPHYMILAANPDIELHWLWKRFHPDSKEWRDRWRLRGYKMITFNSLDNKFLSEAVKDSLMSKGKDFVDRYVLGKWGRPEGVLFDVSPKSILEPTPDLIEMLTKTCALYRTFDHGYSAPTCCLWFAVDKAGNSYVYREYYTASDQIRLHRDSITALSEGEEYRSSLADPAIFQMMPMKAGGRYSVASEYTDCKIYPAKTAIWWSRADNAEIASRHRLKEYLTIDPEREHPVDGTLGAPRLYFVQKTEDYPHGANNVIIETKSAKLTRVAVIDGRPIFNDERDPVIPDHALDPLRYHIMSRPTVKGDYIPPSSIRTFTGYSKFTRHTRKLNDRLSKLDR